MFEGKKETGCWQNKTEQHYSVSMCSSSVEGKKQRWLGDGRARQQRRQEQQHEQPPVRQLGGAGAGLLSMKPLRLAENN